MTLAQRSIAPSPSAIQRIKGNTSITVPSFAWTKLHPSPDPDHGAPCSRSSHGVSVVTGTDGTKTLFLYGGEHVARTPLQAVDAGWLCTDNLTQWKWVDCSTSAPPERIAHAQAVYNNRYVYIFGGRAGIAMQECAMNDMWMFDMVTESWTEIKASGDAIPEARSFHRMICIGANLYLFGGCGSVSGRLNDLHRFDVTTNTWHCMGPSKLRGRGGPNVIPIHSGTQIAVIAGFAGEETNDGQVFDIPTETWSDTILSTELIGLRSRSVCVSQSFPSLGIASIFGGEVDPSDRGHEGAGGFENDLIILDERTGSFVQNIVGEGAWPDRRGWSASDSIDLGNGIGELYLFGGLAGDDETPQRLDDLWRLDLKK